MRRRREPLRSRARGARGAGLMAGAASALLVAGCASPVSDAEPVAEPEQTADVTETQTPAPEGSAPEEPSAPPDTRDTAEPEPAAVLGAGVAPSRLVVPSIDLDEDLIELGLQADGTMEVPTDWDRAGWYAGGGMPGGRGPTVMVGHLDSRTGPAVFFELTELEVGDAVEVTDVEGTVHTYEVYRVDDLPKDDYPTHEVFGAINADELRLITCTGDFDAAALRHADNRVVFAAAT